MFNWGYALIGFMIGFLGIKLPGNSLTSGLFGIAFLGFLIFSASFGFEYFFIGLLEVMAGAGVAMMIMPMPTEDNTETALDEYNGKKSREKDRTNIKKVRITSHTSKTTNENTASKKPLPSKISGQTLFIRQKREINRKLKQKLITKRTAETQMKKALKLEEMRLIIENKGKKPKVKKVIKVKKITAKSSDDFDYVEKLKDITTLREEGAISQAEFKKLKKKIMDTI